MQIITNQYVTIYKLNKYKNYWGHFSNNLPNECSEKSCECHYCSKKNL